MSSFLKRAQAKAEQMRQPPEVALVQVDRKSIQSSDPQKKSYSFEGIILNKTKGSSLKGGDKVHITIQEQKLEDLTQGLKSNEIGKTEEFCLFLEAVRNNGNGAIESRYAKLAAPKFDFDQMQEGDKGRMVNVEAGQDFGTTLRSALTLKVTTQEGKNFTATGQAAIRALLSKQEVMDVVEARAVATKAGNKEAAALSPVAAYSRVIFPEKAIKADSESLPQVLVDLYSKGFESAIVRQAIPTDDGVRVLPITISLRELGKVEEQDRVAKADEVCIATIASLVNRGMSGAVEQLGKNEAAILMDVIPSRLDRVMDHPTDPSRSQLFGLIDDLAGTNIRKREKPKSLSEAAIKVLDEAFPPNGYGNDASVSYVIKRKDGSVSISHPVESSVINYEGVRIHNIPTSVLGAEIVGDAKPFARDPKPESKNEQKAEEVAQQAPIEQAPSVPVEQAPAAPKSEAFKHEEDVFSHEEDVESPDPFDDEFSSVNELGG